MTETTLLRIAIDPALSILPSDMRSNRAAAMLLAIALQESGLRYRRQVGGPARGFWQFERAGVMGVMQHRASSGYADDLLSALSYGRPDIAPGAVMEAIEHNDILAAGFARLLLWTLPDLLPGRSATSESWRQYIEAWRPGKPRRESWNFNYRDAWLAVDSSPGRAVTAHTEAEV